MELLLPPANTERSESALPGANVPAVELSLLVTKRPRNGSSNCPIIQLCLSFKLSNLVNALANYMASILASEVSGAKSCKVKKP